MNTNSTNNAKNKNIKLTPHQQSTFDKVCSEIDKGLKGDKNYSLISFTGPAGSGKSTSLSKIIDRYKNKKIQMTTPTHKSLAVVKDMLIDSNNKNLELSTIHAFLNLRVQNDENTGKVTLRLNDFMKDKNTNTCDILIVDESSMVNFELFQFIIRAIEENRVKVALFTGDQLQLPPVEDGESVIFNTVKPYELTEIVRQAKDNPIIKTSSKIRECIENEDFQDVFSLFSEESTIHLHDNFASFMRTFLSDEKDKIIASYTNNRVDKLNLEIRKKIHGKDVPEFLPGENIVLQDAVHTSTGQPIFINGEIVEVLKAVKEFNPKYELNEFSITAKGELTKTFSTISYDSRNKYNKVLKDLSKRANSYPKNDYNRKKLFREFFMLKDNYIGVKHCYASTIHKLQGSTFENVYIDLQDISRYCRYNDKEFMSFIYRLLYVAVTRASNEVHILNCP